MPHGGGHPHHHHHHHTPDSATRNIGIAFWLNLIFATIELIGGLMVNSLAVLSDALHDFGDALSLGLSYILQIKSKQGPTESFSYGLRRLSLAAAFLTGIVIAGAAIGILYESVQSFQEVREPQGLGMMGLALLGIGVNGFAAWKLSHGHTQNEKMMRWHLFEDVLGWIAVLIGGAGVYVFNWTWLDPLLAIGLSVFVLYNVLRRLFETVILFLQANPNPEGLREFREFASQLSGVQELHDVHFWSLDGVRHILSLHVVVVDGTEPLQIKESIRKLAKKLGDCHLTIEIESTAEHCHDDCEHT